MPSDQGLRTTLVVTPKKSYIGSAKLHRTHNAPG